MSQCLSISGAACAANHPLPIVIQFSFHKINFKLTPPREISGLLYDCSAFFIGHTIHSYIFRNNNFANFDWCCRKREYSRKIETMRAWWVSPSALSNNLNISANNFLSTGMSSAFFHLWNIAHSYATHELEISIDKQDSTIGRLNKFHQKFISFLSGGRFMMSTVALAAFGMIYHNSSETFTRSCRLSAVDGPRSLFDDEWRTKNFLHEISLSHMCSTEWRWKLNGGARPTHSRPKSMEAYSKACHLPPSVVVC